MKYFLLVFLYKINAWDMSEIISCKRQIIIPPAIGCPRPQRKEGSSAYILKISLYIEIIIKIT